MNEIDRRAAEWAVLSGGEPMSPDQRGALEAWLSQDTRNRGAYVRALAIVAQAEKAAARMADPISAPAKVVVFSRRRMILAGSIAASLAIAIVTTGTLWTASERKTYFTAVGETRDVALSDGSRLFLNTNTRTDTVYSKARRSVTLEHGEAQFDVAKNRSRPFVVSAGQVSVTAVGTSFTVKNLSGAPVEVLVRDGVVRVDGAKGGAFRLGAGQLAQIAPDGTAIRQALTPEEFTRRMAWQRGLIYFNNQPLAAVVREFGRYNTTQLIVDDPNISNITISGLYHSNDPVGFAKAAAGSLGLTVVVREDGVHLSKEK